MYFEIKSSVPAISVLDCGTVSRRSHVPSCHSLCNSCSQMWDISQVGKAARICGILVEIFASLLSLLDLFLWDILCTFHLIGGRLGNMTSFGQCNMNGRDPCHFQAQVLRVMCGSSISYFSLPQECQVQDTHCTFPWMPG